MNESGLVSKTGVGCDPNGAADRVLARYTFDSATNAAVPGFFPRRIVSYWINPDSNQEIEQAEYQIHSLKLGNQPLPFSAFDPEPFVSANRWQKRVLKDNAIYAVEPSGALKLLEMLPIPGQAGRPAALQESRSPMVYAVWFGANIGFLILVRRIRKAETTKTLL